MNETWEETKARVNKMTGKLPPVVIDERPKARYDEPVQEVKVPLWEVRKITLPVDPEYPQGKVVLYAVSKEEAEWWLENKFKVKSYQDDTDDSKTLVFFEKFLIDGTPKERNIYSNPERFCIEEFPDFKTPKRVA